MVSCHDKRYNFRGAVRNEEHVVDCIFPLFSRLRLGSMCNGRSWRPQLSSLSCPSIRCGCMRTVHVLRRVLPEAVTTSSGADGSQLAGVRLRLGYPSFKIGGAGIFKGGNEGMRGIPRSSGPPKDPLDSDWHKYLVSHSVLLACWCIPHSVSTFESYSEFVSVALRWMSPVHVATWPFVSVFLCVAFLYYVKVL